MVEELKLKLGVEYTAGMKGTLKAKKWLKRFGYVWILLTFGMAFMLIMDVRSNPELWHVVEGGDTGELLKDIEDSRIADNYGKSNLADWNITVEGFKDIGYVGDDLKYRYPDWVYEIKPESSYQHFYETIRWPVFPWIIMTFLFMGLRLRVSLWEIKNLRGEVNVKEKE